MCSGTWLLWKPWATLTSFCAEVASAVCPCRWMHQPRSGLMGLMGWQLASWGPKVLNTFPQGFGDFPHEWSTNICIYIHILYIYIYTHIYIYIYRSTFCWIRWIRHIGSWFMRALQSGNVMCLGKTIKTCEILQSHVEIYGWLPLLATPWHCSPIPLTLNTP